MATLNPCFYILPLLLHACCSKWSGERRFSDMKRCADDECSMLLGRGKAAKDFTGPDCRFLSFKKAETIYVYYKLSGQRSDVWAGSVGNHFGYFPKDYLTINHIYAEKEIEVPAEETDFVCFDTGLDTFDSYDIDVLLGNSLLIEQTDSSDSESLLEAETEKSESTAHLKTDSSDSESLLEAETEKSESTAHLQTDSSDSESLLEAETEKSESTAHLKTDSSDSESLLEAETESSESTAHLQTDSSDSESLLEAETEKSESTAHPKTESSDSESLLEAETEKSESTAHPKTESSDSESLLEAETEKSESTAHLKTDSSDSESLLEAETEKSESTAHLQTDSSDSESLLEAETEKSESTAHLQTESSDLDVLIETETVDSESVESHEKNVLLSIDEESDSFKPKTDIVLESRLESQDEPEQKDPEAIYVQVPDKQADISPSNDAVALEDVEAGPSDSDPQYIDHFELNNQSDSEQPKRLFDSDDDTDSEHQQLLKPEAQTADSDVDDKEPAKTVEEKTLQTVKTEEKKTLPTAEKTLEEVIEDQNIRRSTFQEAEHTDEMHETEFPEKTTKDRDIEELPDESHPASPENLHTEIDFKKQAIAKDDTTGKLLEPSEDTNTPDATEESSDTQPKSHDITPEPPVESHTETEYESMLSAESMLTDDGDEEEDPQKVDTNKIETANENVADLQKVNINMNENASKNTEDNNLQDTVLKKNTTEDYNIEEVDPKKSEEAAVTLLDKPDEQINQVKNELADLLKNTLESERQSPEDEEEPQDQDEKEDDEELLEDENAFLSSYKSQFTEDTREPEVNQQPESEAESDASDISDLSDNSTEADDVLSSPLTNTTQEEDKKESEHKHEVLVLSEEPVYSDSVQRLTILRDHLKDEDMKRIQKYLGLKNLFKLEAMFSDLEQEMLSVRLSQTSTEDIENTLDQIMEASENSILDETEEMLNEGERRAQEHGQKKEPEMYDMETSILDSFQEIVFSLRQKYSAVSDSAPLIEEEQPVSEPDEQHDTDAVKDLDRDVETVQPPESPEIQEEHNESELILNSEINVNSQDMSHSQDMGLDEDGGHFNKNEDAQIAFEKTEEIQKGPHAILEKPLDIGFHVEVDPSSGSQETPGVSDFHDTETNTDISSSSTSDELWSLLLLFKEYLGVYAEVMIAALPEEWRPGPTFHGVPWEPVLVTAAVGFLTVVMFFWRTVLAIKGRTYQLTEKQLREKIQQLLSEKSDAVNKISQLNDVIKEHEEQLKNSQKTLTSSQQEMKQLKTHHQKLQSQCEEMSGSILQLNQKIIETQGENSNLNEKIVKMHQRIEKYQNTLKNFDEERAKVHVLMDEAKFREDALKAQVNCFEKENSAVKEQKKSLLRDAKDWQEKHEKLSDEIRVYHKSQKELEDSLMHKENEIDVLSSCIAELTRLGACDAADLQKEDAKMSHGEEADKKMDSMRLRIKQMMDVSRIKATLSVIEEERNRYMESLLAEQRSRQELEEQYQAVMHDQMNLKNEKTHLENQFKNLQQRLEITTELYQQKENALQQKLTQEELERREKETKLSEVDGKAVRSEEELRVLKQKIRDIEEEMQQNEQTLKSEVAVQEKKAHENWLKARASERALVEERRESATLRQRLVECSDKIADMEQTLFKLNSAPPDRHVPPMRRGDSYGPSPVSGGAPSPPLMIEGPGRPPSAPVGRRSDSFGPRLTSETHGRFSDLGHPLPARPEMFPPMTSSPCAHDGPMQTAAVAETAEVSEQVPSEPVEPLSKSQSQGSFLPSPIRDSPVPPLNAPLKSYGPPLMGGPLPPNGPPPLMIRPPNGHPPMMPPGPPLGPEPRFRPPPMDSYGPPPPIGPFGPVPPPFARGPPLRDLPPMGPLPPLGPRDVPPEFYGPRGFPPRPFSAGPLPPPRAMVPPPYGGRGFSGATPLMAQSSRDDEENVTPANNPPTDGPPQGTAQDTGGSSVAEP